MASENLVSVVVPVYNVREYLERCFWSVANQSYPNLEIVLVDDGSTDGSGELCDELAARDGRAVVVHKENGGLSDACNCGLRAASGDWVSFVDSDDYVSPVFIEVLLGVCLSTGCRVSAVPFGTPFRDGEGCALVESAASVPPAEAVPSYEVQRLMLYQALDTGAPWRLYARGALGEDPFPRGLYYEDLASVYKVVHGVGSVAVVDCRGLYAYRMRGDSIIRQGYRHIKGESALRIADRLYRDICGWYPGLEAAAASRCFSVCRMVFAQATRGRKSEMGEDASQDAADLWEVISRHRKTVLLDASARKRERLAAGVACLGRAPFTLFCRLCHSLGRMQ